MIDIEDVVALLEKGSYMALASTVKAPEKLYEGQQVALAYSLLAKKSLVSLPTGRGKTYIASAFIKSLLEAGATGLTCVVVNNTARKQIIKDIKRLTGKEVLLLTGNTESVKRKLWGIEGKKEIIVLTYEALTNKHVSKLLFTIASKVDAFVFDESLNLGGGDTWRSRMSKEMIKHVEYTLFLTATPLSTHPEQFILQLNMLNENITLDMLNKYKEYDYKTKTFIGWKNLEDLQVEVIDTYLNLTDEMLGVNSEKELNFEAVEPTPHQMKVSNNEIRKDKNGAHIAHLSRYISGLDKGKRGIIYANKNEYKEIVMEILDFYNISYTIMDGEYSKSLGLDREEERIKFEDGEYQVVLTNITESLNLDSDFVYFFEFTVKMIQMIGRASRGYDSGKTEIVMCLIRNTDEVRFFYEKIYARSKLMSQACGKNTDVIEKLYREVIQC